MLIDDASPIRGSRSTSAKLERRAHPQVVLLRNERNLGFTGTANRGMQLSRADVVLLNSDTIVSAGWLDAIMHCAATDPRHGTITPFSNNAEICSFPRFCVNNPWPPGTDPEPVRAALAAVAVPTYPDLPTGVGFCMYIRRALLDDVGVFDMAFGLGYGEENDLCLRAARAGWRNVLADNAFVAHTGGQSFAGQKAELGARNMALLLERHPHYLDMVRAYIAADPLRPLREAAAMRCAVDAKPGRGVLHVIHDHGGGTETHVRALIAGSRARWRHYLAIAVGDRWQVEEHRDDGTVVTFDLCRDPDERWRDFLGAICASFGIALIHLHNVSACREGILTALAQPPVPYGYTVHDLNFACPTITFLAADGMYCGTPTDADVCRRCLAAQPAFDGSTSRRGVRAIAACSRGPRSASRLRDGRPTRSSATSPECAATVIAHGSPDNLPPRAPGVRTTIMLPDDDVPTVAVLGAIGPDKGARRIERLAALVRARGARVRFVLIGYMDVQHGPWQSDDAVFTVHGRYAPADLPDLLAHYRAALVLYPSAGPETFSYTLTEAWAAGRPVLVPPFGALAERVQGSDAGWVMTDAEWRSEARMLDRILALVAPAAAAQLGAAAAHAQSLPHVTLSGDDGGDVRALRARARGAASVRCRRRAAAGARAPAARARLRAVASAGAGAQRRRAPDLLARLARAAARRRHTLAGRVLFRLAPAKVLATLRAKLK